MDQEHFGCSTALHKHTQIRKKRKKGKQHQWYALIHYLTISLTAVEVQKVAVVVVVGKR